MQSLAVDMGIADWQTDDDELRAYAYWVMRTGAFRNYCLRFARGTAVRRVNARDIEAFSIPNPNSSVLRDIVKALRAIEETIEVNRRINGTLEAIARGLFKSWFVDFDPVRAKIDGRQPRCLDSTTAALFPNEFVRSDLGPVPLGWTVTTLRQACEGGGGGIQTGPFGTQLHASDYVQEGIPLIMPADLRDNRIDTSEIAHIREADAERLSMYRVEPGDVVYSRRGDVERRALIRAEEAGWLCGTGCLRVRFGASGLNPDFGAAYLGTAEARAWVVRHAVGATMPNLNTAILGELPLLVPPSELQQRFAQIIEPLDKRGTTALVESRTLASIRDALLPKLLTGDLQISRFKDGLE